ncbi:hypothetical protein [Paraburkholderia sp. MM6662-R1]|uniref:hypothetical protein n=1 Tax=Paraburkholderia sp. MM6662-R1 TaxID=2991066 RepID=UPI003D1D7CC3
MFRFSLPKYALVQLGAGNHTTTVVHMGDGEFVGDALPPLLEGAAPKDDAGDGLSRFAVRVVDSPYPRGFQAILCAADIEGVLAEEFRRIEAEPGGQHRLAKLMAAMNTGPLATWREVRHPLLPAAIKALAALATGSTLDDVVAPPKAGS